jgi:hypothetical protein
VTREQLLGNLDFVLYQYLRGPDSRNFTGLDAMYKAFWRRSPNRVLEDVIASITWALDEPDLDFTTITPTFRRIARRSFASWS